MMRKSKKKVLIIGDCAKEHALAKQLAKLDEVEEIFVAPGNAAMQEFCTCVDIRENNVNALIDFALENKIDLTIAASNKSIKADIAMAFSNANLMIFAPTADAANICVSKSAGKKFIYRLKIPTAKFGIFDKAQMAHDYVKNSRMPIVVKTDEHRSANGTLVCASQSMAHNFIDECFFRGESKVVIEDFVYGHEFSFYVVTDGYHALPLSSAGNYKFTLDGDGGVLTPGTGSYAPDYKISNDIEAYIMNEIIFPTLNVLADMQTPYVGILGFDAVLTPENDVVVLEFNTFMQEHDCQGILSLLNENIYQLCLACTVGSFADDYSYLEYKNLFAASCVLSSSASKPSIISGLDKIDDEISIAHFNTKKNAYLEYEAQGGRSLVLTANARTLSRAREVLYDELDLIEFDGKKYRKDICAVTNY